MKDSKESTTLSKNLVLREAVTPYNFLSLCLSLFLSKFKFKKLIFLSQRCFSYSWYVKKEGKWNAVRLSPKRADSLLECEKRMKECATKIILSKTNSQNNYFQSFTVRCQRTPCCFLLYILKVAGRKKSVLHRDENGWQLHKRVYFMYLHIHIFIHSRYTYSFFLLK